MSEQLVIPWPEDKPENLVSVEPLRDRIAMAALTGLIASPMRHGEPEVYAISAYRFADAMLQARKVVKS